jgi:hypothetical protein
VKTSNLTLRETVRDLQRFVRVTSLFDDDDTVESIAAVIVTVGLLGHVTGQGALSESRVVPRLSASAPCRLQPVMLYAEMFLR